MSDAGMPSLQYVADSQFVHAAHSQMMRFEAPSRTLGDVAEDFCLLRLAAICSVFDMVLGAALTF